MAARIVFTSGFSRRYTGGVREFTVEAKNLRGVIKEMDRLYPGLGEHLEEETTVAIDGATTRPPISSRSAKAARSSSFPSSKGDSHPRDHHLDDAPVADCPFLDILASREYVLTYDRAHHGPIARGPSRPREA
jgi:hypothetical protein